MWGREAWGKVSQQLPEVHDVVSSPVWLALLHVACAQGQQIRYALAARVCRQLSSCHKHRPASNCGKCASLVVVFQKLPKDPSQKNLPERQRIEARIGHSGSELKSESLLGL